MTLKEIAAQANVSPSAVSRFLNGGSLSEEKRRAIQDVVDKTGYQPNQLAHNLRTGRVNQIGMSVPKLHSNSVGEILEGVNSVLGENDYLALVGVTGGDIGQEAKFLQLVQSYCMAGVIILATSVTREKEALYRSCSIPLVVTGQRYESLNCVYHDDFHAMHELARLLIEHRRKKIVYIGVDEADPAVGIQRKQGAVQALKEAGFDGDAMSVTVSGFSTEGGYHCMKELLLLAPDLDGVLCATDSIAHGAMAALREAGKRIPRDVSIAGVGNDWPDRYSIPQLTTARLFQVQCGREAANILMDLVRDDTACAPARKIMLGYRIEKRASV